MRGSHLAPPHPHAAPPHGRRSYSATHRALGTWAGEEEDNGKWTFHKSGNNAYDLVLTASTKELQEFVLTYARNDKAFPEPAELHRQK